jgi:molybdopterin-guanine dinucleotide biosynthesis adapter protein
MKVMGIAGYSGSGKTTLVERLIPVLRSRGLRVSVVKHAHHDFEIDHVGKDSWRHRQAGAAEVLVTSSRRWALVHELRDDPEPALQDHLARLGPCDIVLVEGFKREPIPKLEVHRVASGKPSLWPTDGDIVGVATDAPIESDLPRFPLDAIEAIADFVMAHLGLQAGQSPRTDDPEPPC